MSRAQNNWEYLEKIRAQMNDMSDHVSGGACKEFSDYQKVLRNYRGFSPCRERTSRLAGQARKRLIRYIQ